MSSVLYIVGACVVIALLVVWFNKISSESGRNRSQVSLYNTKYIYLNGELVGNNHSIEQDVVSTGAWPIPDEDNKRGWRYINDSKCENLHSNTYDMIDWYFMRNHDVEKKNYNYSKFRSFYVRLRISEDATKYPFFVIYTNPTDPDTDYSSDYRSRKVYSLPSDVTPCTGKDIIFYIGCEPKSKECLKTYELIFNPDDSCSYEGPEGQTDIDPCENVENLALETKSSWCEDHVDFTVLYSGWKFSHCDEHVYITKFPCF